MNESNRFSPPSSGFNAPPREPGSELRGVLLGSLADIGGTFVLNVIFGIVAVLILGRQGYSVDQVQENFRTLEPLSPMWLVITGSGLMMSAIGGYVCAYTANRNTYRPLGFQSLIISLYGAFSGASQSDIPMLIGMTAVTVVAIYIGGWLYNRKIFGATL